MKKGKKKMKMTEENTLEINISWKLVDKVTLMVYVVFALSVFLISITGGPVGMMVLHIASADFLVLAGTLPFCIVSGRQDAEFFGSLSALLAGYMLVVLSCI